MERRQKTATIKAKKKRPTGLRNAQSLFSIGIICVVSVEQYFATKASPSFGSADFFHPPHPSSERASSSSTNSNSAKTSAVAHLDLQLEQLRQEFRSKHPDKPKSVSPVFPNPTGSCHPKVPRNWTSPIRSERFPSVEERLCHYLSVWYDPNWNTTSTIQRGEIPKFTVPVNATYVLQRNRTSHYLVLTQGNETHHLGSCLSMEKPFHIKLHTGEDLIRSVAKHKIVEVVKDYSVDFVEFLDIFHSLNISTPILVQFGDWMNKIRSISNVPFLGKWRYATEPKPNAYVVMLLNLNTHYGGLRNVQLRDIPWKKKQNGAVWRGIMSGFIESKQLPVPRYLNWHKNADDLFKCKEIPRCKFVWTVNAVVNDTRIDAAFNRIPYSFPKSIRGVNLTAPVLTLQQMMRRKILISLEGNDVASNLKWALYSNSVVLAPPPTKMTFGLENLLEPWIHYVPLARDYSDLQQQVSWVFQNDAAAQRIGQLGKQFISDLMFEGGAQEDNREVQRELALRYAKMWEGVRIAFRNEEEKDTLAMKRNKKLKKGEFCDPP